MRLWLHRVHMITALSSLIAESSLNYENVASISRQFEHFKMIVGFFFLGRAHFPLTITL